MTFSVGIRDLAVQYLASIQALAVSKILHILIILLVPSLKWQYTLHICDYY